MPSEGAALVVRHLGCRDYQTVWDHMRAFTESRDPGTPDELWLLEHPPVYTLGRNARTARPAVSADATGTRLIPVVQTDRGGDITYHAPGQIVAYTLIDITRRGIGVHALVRLLEQATIETLADNGILGERRPGAPGIYVNDAKIAQLGLRVRRGRTYHGLSVNVTLNPAPFRVIPPCGYPGLAVTRILDLLPPATDPVRCLERIRTSLRGHLIASLGYNPGLVTTHEFHEEPGR